MGPCMRRRGREGIASGWRYRRFNRRLKRFLLPNWRGEDDDPRQRCSLQNFLLLESEPGKATALVLSGSAFGASRHWSQERVFRAKLPGACRFLRYCETSEDS